MSVEATEKILVGIIPENSRLSEEEMEDARCGEYEIIGSYFTGEVYIVGLPVSTDDLMNPDWHDIYKALWQQVSEDLDCDIDAVELHTGVLYH